MRPQCVGVGGLGVWGLRFVLAQPLCAPRWPLSGAFAALALHALKTATLALQSLKTVTLAACCRSSAAAAAAASSICRRASASNGASRCENRTRFRYCKLTLWCFLISQVAQAAIDEKLLPKRMAAGGTIPRISIVCESIIKPHRHLPPQRLPPNNLGLHRVTHQTPSRLHGLHLPAAGLCDM